MFSFHASPISGLPTSSRQSVDSPQGAVKRVHPCAPWGSFPPMADALSRRVIVRHTGPAVCALAHRYLSSFARRMYSSTAARLTRWSINNTARAAA